MRSCSPLDCRAPICLAPIDDIPQPVFGSGGRRSERTVKAKMRIRIRPPPKTQAVAAAEDAARGGVAV